MQKHYFAKKDVTFSLAPPSAKLCQKIVSDFCADTSPDVFEETGCAVCGKLTPIYEMEVLAKVDGITRNVRYKSTDPVEDGLLVRKVPNELQDLTYAEKLLIARV